MFCLGIWTTSLIAVLLKKMAWSKLIQLNNFNEIILLWVLVLVRNLKAHEIQQIYKMLVKDLMSTRETQAAGNKKS